MKALHQLTGKKSRTLRASLQEKLGDNPRLSLRLAVTLSLTLLAVLVLATIAAATTAYFQSSELQDETLLSVAHLVESNQIAARYNPKMFLDDDIDEGVRVWEIDQNGNRFLRIKPTIKPGFHTLKSRHRHWRIYITSNPETGKHFAIGQKLSVKASVASTSAFNTAIPLLLLFVLVPALVLFIVRHSFKPLGRITRKIADSDSLSPDLSSKKDIPVEVLPFIGEIESLIDKNRAFNKRQRRFIADAAHELRTPITALSLEIENIHNAQDEQTRTQRQNALMHSVDRLQRLVNQLLDLARAQSVDEPQHKETKLINLVKSQIEDLIALADAKDIELIVEKSEPVTVLDNNNQLQHLIRNGLSNALKFAPQGGTIRLAIYQRASEAVLDISDNGPGVADSDLLKLHEAFYRPIEQQTSAGAGLGLAICHEIATSLGGVLRLENIGQEDQPGGFKFSYSQKLA